MIRLEKLDQIEQVSRNLTSSDRILDYLNVSWTVPVLLICPSYLIIHKKFPAQLLVARGSRAVAGLSYSTQQHLQLDFQTQFPWKLQSELRTQPYYTKFSVASETLNRFVPVQLATVSKLSARGSRTALDSGFEAWAPLFWGFPLASFARKQHGPCCGLDGQSAYPYLPASSGCPFFPHPSPRSPHFPCRLPVHLPLLSSMLAAELLGKDRCSADRRQARLGVKLRWVLHIACSPRAASALTQLVQGISGEGPFLTSMPRTVVVLHWNFSIGGTMNI